MKKQQLFIEELSKSGFSKIEDMVFSDSVTVVELWHSGARTMITWAGARPAEKLEELALRLGFNPMPARNTPKAA